MAGKDPYEGTPYEGMSPYEKALERMRIDPFGKDITSESERKDLASLQKWADARLKILEKLHADEKKALKGRTNYEREEKDVRLKHDLESLKLSAENDKKTWEYKLNNAKDYTSRLDGVFKDFYNARGKDDKMLFLLHKAAAMATIIIKTSQGIMLALGENNWPMALLITAEGAAQMATVSAQTLARGGLVQGYSPTKTADNIPLRGTAGEFMHPVDAVEYYGTRVHEAMRQKLIPREFFSGLTLPSAPGPSGGSLQTGGLVGGAGRSELTILNLMDPRELDRYLATPSGKDAIINVLSSRLQTVRRMIR